MFSKLISMIGVLSTVCFVSLSASAEDYPTPPKPSDADGQLFKQAGMGSQIAYAEAGVLELGGSLSFVTANNFDQLSVSPSVGWFFTNNIQLSGILSYNTVSAHGQSATYWTVLAEPSYHYPFSKTVFGLAGLGVGLAHADSGTGTAIQPRVGVNILIGRSGILTPAFFTAFNTIDSVAVGGGSNLLSVDRISGFNVGYTVIW